VNAVKDSIGNIAAGQVGAATNYIESALARSLSVAINFLARQVGLGNVGQKVRDIIKRVQGKIDAAMNKLIEYVAQQGKSWLLPKAGVGRSNNQQPMPNNRPKPQPTTQNRSGQNNRQPAPNQRPKPQPTTQNRPGQNNRQPAPNQRPKPQPATQNRPGQNNRQPAPNQRPKPQPATPGLVPPNNKKVPNNRSDRQQKEQAKLVHDRKVKKGLAEIQAEEKKLIKGMIRKQEAQSIAAKIKRNNPIFKSITVIDGGDTWDYKWVASQGTQKGTVPQAEKVRITKEELEAIARQAFNDQLFTAKQLLEYYQTQWGKENAPSIETVQRRLKDLAKENIISVVGDTNSRKYTFNKDLAKEDTSAGGERFKLFRTESPWKPSDRGNEPVFGHPTKKINNRYSPYQVSSPRYFRSSDYINFFVDSKKIGKAFSDEVARVELNNAIEQEKLSKVGSKDARTYAITEGEKPGYSSYVMPLNIPTPNRDLPDEVRREIIEIIKKTKLALDPQPSSWNTETKEVWIKLLPNTYQRDIKTVLENGQTKEIADAKPEEKEEIQKMYATWQKINNKEDWHHTWPQWLGGAEIQTPKLYMPRWIHHFGGDDKLGAVAFHQHLRAVWDDSNFYKKYQVPHGSRREFQEAFHRAPKNEKQKFKKMVKEVLLEAYKRTFTQANGQEIIDKISELLNQELIKVVIPKPKTKQGK